MRRVVPLDPGHRIIDKLADLRFLCPGIEVRPKSLRRYPEDVLGTTLVPILRIGVFVLLTF